MDFFLLQHPNYQEDGDGTPNDIAILRLERPVNLTSSNIEIATLPNITEEFVGAQCYITGWGKTSMYST